MAEGDTVRLEVIQTAPRTLLRLLDSDSGQAARLATSIAENTTQTLVRAPALMARVMQLLNLDTGTPSTAPQDPLDVLSTGLSGTRTPGTAGRAGVATGVATAAVGRTGASLLQGLLQRHMPTVSLQSLMEGDVLPVLQNAMQQSPQQVAEGVRQMNIAAEQVARLLPTGTVPGSSDPATTTTALTPDTLRSSVQQLGELLISQKLVPMLSLTDEKGFVLNGYQMFWLQDGGFGELIWRQRPDDDGSTGGQGEQMATVLLSLHMTQLGRVQALVSFSRGRISVSVSAAEESALVELRQNIGLLRQRLLEEGLVIDAIELSRHSEQALEAGRRAIMGSLESGFSARG
jgi:hypothetical protein